MDKVKSSALPVILILAAFFLIAWGTHKGSRCNTLESDVEIYRARLAKYEDTTIIDSIIDSLNEEGAENERFEDQTNSYKYR